MYSFNASWYPLKKLEVHGEISYTPDADFLPNEIYSVGLRYMLNPQVSLLFDVEQLNFDSDFPAFEDDITQIKPGVSFWFTEKSFVTFRYTHGWVHSQVDYDYYSAAVTIGDMPYNGQLTLGFAYGTDPDLDFGLTGATLSNAYILSIFYKQPINPDLSVFAGVEYVYREHPNNGGQLYQKITPTIGLSWKF
jgi:YaiO family outer membrane protein